MMCPACLTTFALIAAGAGSAGGLVAVVAKKFRAKPEVKQNTERLPTETPVNKAERR